MARGGGVSPAVILKSIGGISFPATKQQIIDYVKKNAGNNPVGAAGQEEGPDRIIQVLNQIDDKEYQAPNEILKEIGEVE